MTPWRAALVAGVVSFFGAFAVALALLVGAAEWVTRRAKGRLA